MTSLILPADGMERLVPGAAGSSPLVSCAAAVPDLASLVGPLAPEALGMGGSCAPGVSRAAALPVWASAARTAAVGRFVELDLSC